MTTLLFVTLLAQAEKLPEGPGKTTLVKACGGCHAPEAVIGANNTKQGWTERAPRNYRLLGPTFPDAAAVKKRFHNGSGK